MKTTLQGLQALQIALRNRVERLPDGSIAIKIKNDFQCVTLGDLAAFVEASSGRIRFSRKDLDSDYNFYFMEMSRNQAKRLRKKLQDWVDAEIEKEIAAQCAERGQAAIEAGEGLKHMLNMYMFDSGGVLTEMISRYIKNPPTSPLYGIMQKSANDLPSGDFRPGWMGIYSDIPEKLPRKTPNSFPPADFGQGSAVFEDYLSRRAREAAKYAEIEQLKAALSEATESASRAWSLFSENEPAAKALRELDKVNKELDGLKTDLEAANLTKDGALKLAGKLIVERNELQAEVEERGKVLRDVDNARDAILRRNKELHQCLEAFEKENETLKGTNAELVRQAQAHNQEAIQLREALENMTRLRDEALGKSVRLPVEGDFVAVKSSMDDEWLISCAELVHGTDLVRVPTTYGHVFPTAKNHGTVWRWPAKKERTAADVKVGDLVKYWGHTNLLAVHKVEGKMICLFVPGESRIIWTSADHFGQTWRFAD